ncbi:hypothetical protein BC832DRAFT_592124 [Gaertneriomyces semiglobifer]|nr:hypothetical protein BC832DRAFT_592124 [Gaertneriomyces semiglobifer]
MPAPENWIHHPAAIVTGASRGIGRAIAIAFAKEGFHLGLISTNLEELSEVKCACLAAGSADVLALPCDIQNDAEVQSVVEGFMRHFGSLALLINNAGVGNLSDPLNATWNNWNDIVQTNMVGAMRITKQCLPMLRSYARTRERSCILNIASTAALRPQAGTVPYGPAEAGLLHFSNSLFEDVRGSGIKVCAISPGWVETSMTAGTPAKNHKHFMRPETVAEAALFVWNFPRDGCPTEIVIRPQLNTNLPISGGLI